MNIVKKTIFLIVLIYPHLLFPQKIYFKLYTSKEGLPNARILCITQDRDGNIWLGTEGGAIKYDGVNFQNYTKSNGIASDFVKTIYQDKNGRLWLGTKEGLSVFLQGKFLSLIHI